MTTKHRRIAAAFVSIGLVALISTPGCIAVSREVRHEPAGAETRPGQWQFDQEWQCRGAGSFDLDRGRAEMDASVVDRAADGWELIDFEVVSIPVGASPAEQVCLVATYRRWVPEKP